MNDQNITGAKPCSEYQEVNQKYLALNENEITELKQAKEDAVRQKKYLETILNTTVDGFWIVDSEGYLLDVNDSYCKMSGYSKEELKLMHINDIDADEKPLDTKKRLQQIINNGSDFFETRHRRKEGSIFDVEFSVTYWDLDGGQFICFCRDTTTRKHAEKQLALLSHSVEQNPASILITDAKGKIDYVNPSFIKSSGFSLDEIKGENPRILKSGHQSQEFYKNLWDTILSGKMWQGEIRNKKKNGELFWENVIISPIVTDNGEISHFVSVKEDITGRKHIEEAMLRSLKEKEILLSEIHHRVKNNLAVISSLLELQITYSDLSNEPDKILRDIQNRIKSMAIVHEMVYRSNNFSEINAGKLVQNLVTEIQKINLQHKTKISIQVHCDEIMLDMNKSVPFTLLVNELITNAYKHAFKNRIHGNIEVFLKKKKTGFSLFVQDDGAGVSDYDKLNKPKSFGYTIIHGLVHQLRGKIKFVQPKNGGIKVECRFSDEKMIS